MNRLAGRVALVTGAGRGIGRSISLAYAAEGARVVAMARTESDLRALAGEIEARGGLVLTARGDVSNPVDAKRVVGEALTKFGMVDVLVNNAGVGGTAKSLQEITEAEWEEVMRTNVTGAFFMTREVLPGMLERRSGNVINVSSGAGHRRPRDFVRSVPYAVSKFAIEGLTDSLATRLKGTGVNVNAMSPGPTRTSIQATWTASELEVHAKKLGKLQEPEAVNDLAIYLAALPPGERTGESMNVAEWNGARTASARA